MGKTFGKMFTRKSDDSDSSDSDSSSNSGSDQNEVAQDKSWCLLDSWSSDSDDMEEQVPRFEIWYFGLLGRGAYLQMCCLATKQPFVYN